MVPDPLRQHEITPYPICDADKIASLEQQLATATTVPLIVHLRSLEAAERRFQDERDRRYSEVGQEREKALKIKETADLAALELARESQTSKDSRADELRDRFSSGEGNRRGRDQIMTWILGSGVVSAVIAGIITYFIVRH
jgi:hypothetical protein